MGGKKPRIGFPRKSQPLASDVISESTDSENDLNDFDQPIEQMTGILGYTWDGVLVVIDDCLELLEVVPWVDYFARLDDILLEHHIEFFFNDHNIKIDVSEVSDVAHILMQTDFVSVMRDTGPDDAGPASGSGYLFFMSEGENKEIVRQKIAALVQSVMEDLRGLEQV